MSQVKEVSVPLEAIAIKTEFKGVPVKQAFYTAGYPEGSNERYLAPMNHASTYVIEGNRWGLAEDLLVRTGNGLAGIEPEILGIVGSREEGDFVIYQGRRLSEEDQRKVIDELGLRIDYELTSTMIGMITPGERILEVIMDLDLEEP